MINSRNILLLEPNYKNKYPPIGLMKISTYHRMLGDNISFFKGDLRAFILDQVYQLCANKLKQIEISNNWLSKHNLIKSFLKKKDLTIFNNNEYLSSNNQPLIKDCLNYYRSYYIKGKYKLYPIWDRVYITTLFTFYWKITIETIEFAKYLVKDLSELKVGGVMASLLPNEIKSATGIQPFEGLLDRTSILDPDNDLIIDNLPLDYSILDEIEYEYPTQNAYFTFMTKGCKRKCSFCAVPKIEPTYIPKIDTITKFNAIKELCGEQQNLLLMDNNVLASPKFPEIIQEIKDIGFYKGATYIKPNQLDIAIRNLKNGINDKAYIRRSFNLIHKLIKYLRGKTAQNYYNLLEEHDLFKYETTTKENILAIYPKIVNIYERIRPKLPKLRFVDFNQGVDCRYVTDEYMKLISEIPIQPLRIAFDFIGLKDKYIKAVNLAAKHGIKKLSNYILYNYRDTPEELYERLKINIKLSEELGLHIYSFPMKYIPLSGEDSKNRNYISINWNIKFIRAIQAILNVTKGIVPPANKNEKGRSFFEKAFGKDPNEFRELLYMPETYIVYRKIFEKDLGYTDKWFTLFRSLSSEEFEEVRTIIEKNDFKGCFFKTKNPKLLQLLNHYTISRDDVKKEDAEYKNIKNNFDKLIFNDKYLNMTITYDYEDKLVNNYQNATV